jgi:competence protein ComEC
VARHNSRNESARARAKAWSPDIGVSRPAGLLVPDGITNATRRLQERMSAWVAAETAPGRLLPWIPVAFGFGIVAYFAADREPAWWASIVMAIAAIVAAYLARRRAIAFPLAVALAAAGSGFAAATLQTLRIGHPILQHPVGSALLAGFVEVREERERSDRIVIRLERFEAAGTTSAPRRVRVAVRKGSAPAVGTFVELKAHLSPPLQPLRPGGYEFARDMYFQRIGASGYALGTIKVKAAPVERRFWLNYASTIDAMRERIDKRIRAVTTGGNGSIASALITGKRDAISAPVNDAMYVSSLAHVLSISGYHMAVVAGIVFFFIRAGLALVPAFASRHPIKKWAASGAIIAAAFYLLLSGAEVATQRSFIMIAIVLAGVILDRSALTFRTLAVAAIAVLLLAPHAVVHPSFQMSFAATLALIATYQHGLPWRPDRDSSLGRRVALWGVREFVALLLASLVAGLATTPYAAYHFHRLAPYGVLANLLAMPVVSALVMPMGILGVVTMPFGFDAVFWRLMGDGIDWMVWVALWVSSLPGAIGRMPAFGTGPLLAGTAGLLLVCLLRTPLRWCGAVFLVAAALCAMTTPRPDVLVADDGQTVAIRGADGRLSVLRSGRDSFALKEWLAADADARTPNDAIKDASRDEGVRCDAIGCIGKLGDGRLVSMVLEIEAFAEDCARAAVVVSARKAPSSACAATLIDREVWRARGTIALRWTGNRFEQSFTHPDDHERPWTRVAAGSASTTPAPASSASSDATPRPEGLDADD